VASTQMRLLVAVATVGAGCRDRAARSASHNERLVSASNPLISLCRPVQDLLVASP